MPVFGHAFHEGGQVTLLGGMASLDGQTTDSRQHQRWHEAPEDSRYPAGRTPLESRCRRYTQRNQSAVVRQFFDTLTRLSLFYS
ncbi:hypothetical protein [Thermonema sp.]|uniref:hypothetical protein n=1 Tax=Thermonema sp. TaxID=2231181 RepID=UPI0027E3DEE2|nr:hypothetical protein [Thermonema sp.]